MQQLLLVASRAWWMGLFGVVVKHAYIQRALDKYYILLLVISQPE
jgi:hypothetical protein